MRTIVHPLIAVVSIALCGTLFSRSCAADIPAGLARTAECLKTNEHLTIGYFGGSLTAGSGASNAEKTSWRAMTTEWFKKRFPGARIEAINGSIGGTGSDLGVYRVGVDLLDRKPDLVFVEFAVNDSGAAKGKIDAVTPAMEGIVRQIWRSNPLADIVFVYTGMQAFEEYYSKDIKPPSVVLHQKLADYYHIPSVNIGEALWKRIKSGEATWEQLLPDKVHPRDPGYAIYAEAMAKFLDGLNWNTASKTPAALPVKLSANTVEYGRFVDAWSVDAPGWTREEMPVSLRAHRIASNQPKTELHFKFSGDAIGVFWLSADDSGNVEWSVDGSPFQSRASWSFYGGKAGRGYSAMFKNPLYGGGLPLGNHVLTLRVAEQTHPKSTGNWVRIAAFLVNDIPAPAAAGK